MILLVGLCGCGGASATLPATADHVPEKVALVPRLDAGTRMVFHVTVTVETETSGTRDRGEMRLDDTVEVLSSSSVRDRFSNVTTAGEGALGQLLRRVATLLPVGSVTTRFDEHWQRIASDIDGVTDDEVRTMLMNLTPVVSFRLLPHVPVCIGEDWESGWDAPLRSEMGAATGRVKTSVRYRLESVAPCGARRCATITARGADDIPPQGVDSGSGTSAFDARLVVDVANLVPASKRIVSTTKLTGMQAGQTFDYANTVTVEVQRAP